MPSTISDTIQLEGDNSFTGFCSRRNPLTLQPGQLQMARNMRLDPGIAQTRKGAMKLAPSLAVPNTPVTLPFNLKSFSVPGNAAVPSSNLIKGNGTGSSKTVVVQGFTTFNVGDQIVVSGSEIPQWNGTFTVKAIYLNASGVPSSWSYDGSAPSPGTSGYFYGLNSITVCTGPVIHNSYSGGLFNAGVYSSPIYQNGQEYIVLVGPTALYLYNTSTGTTNQLAYPVTGTNSDLCNPADLTNVIQAFDKLFLFRWRPTDAPLPISSIVQGASAITAATAPVIPVTSSLVSSGSPTLSNSSTTITMGGIATSGLQVGQSITFSGQTGTYNSVLNGTWTIASVTGTGPYTITFAVTTAPTGTALPSQAILGTQVGGTISYTTASSVSTVTLLGLSTAALSVGQSISFSGLTNNSLTGNNALLNGTWTISGIPSGSSLTFQVPNTVPQTTAMGAAAVLSAFQAGSSVAYSGTSITLSGLSTTQLIPGQQIVFSGQTGNNACLNGTWTIATIPSANSITFAIVQTPTGTLSASAALTGTTILNGQVTVTTSSPHGFSTNDVVRISGTASAGLNVDATITVPTGSATTFTYTASLLSIPNAPTSAISSNGTPALTYLGPTITLSGISVGSLAVGNPITFSGQTGNNACMNGTWTISAVSTSASSVTFQVGSTPAGTLSASSALSNAYTGGATQVLTAQRVQCPLYWDTKSAGMQRVPTTPNPNGVTYSNLISPYNAVACFFNNQLVIASRKDNILVSDILNPFNFDPITKALRCNAGSNDYLVALWPYAGGQILVLMRKSLYLATVVLASNGVGIDPVNSSVQLLTQEIGCVARQTVATAGNYLYFLSDNGVYKLDNSQIDLALRGNTMPLSEPIGDQIALINPAFLASANALYFNNRYYVAVSILDNAGNQAQYNNTLLVYNQLNDAWESIDSYPFSLENLVVSTYNNTRRLYVASNTGGIMLLDQYDPISSPNPNNAAFGDDGGSGVASVPIQGSMTTRRYFYGNLARKRINRISINTQMRQGSYYQEGLQVKANCIDPDNSTIVADVQAGSSTNYTVRGSVRRTADYIDVTVTTSGGRPSIRALQVDASITIDPSRLSRTDS